MHQIHDSVCFWEGKERNGTGMRVRTMSPSIILQCLFKKKDKLAIVNCW